MASTNIESVDGLRLDSALAENQFTDTELLDIPDLAITNILRHLELHTLKKLRLVSKSTKQWVEQTEFLQKLKIHISSDEIQEEISNSTEVPWNNFVITMKRNGLFQEINEKFAEKFAPSVKHLVMNRDRWIDLSDNIIRSMVINTSLETLCIKNLRLEIKGYWSLDPPIWMRNLERLKTLKIEKCPFSFGLNPPELVIAEAKMMFDMILQSSPNLTQLHLPTLRFFDKDDDVKSKDLHYQIVLSPLLNYLNRIHNSKKRQNLTIDMDGFEDEYQNRKIFPMSPEGLLELSKLCIKTGTKLCNVTSLAFTNRTNVSHVDMNTYKEVISSVKMLNDPSGVRGIYLPPGLKIYVEIRADAEANYRPFELQEPIHSVNFSSNYFPIEENLYSNLFKVVRPSVQEFKCDWYMDWNSYCSQGYLQTISTSFPNLKSLHLEKSNLKWEWGPSRYGHNTSDFNVLLIGLPLLERLSLKNCYLYEERDMRPNNPFMVQLQNLVHLEFIDTNIRDLHITGAFRYMRLKTFVLKCDSPLHAKEDHCSVTFKTGISSLCSIDGGFGDTIEHFDIYIPHDCTRDVLDVFVNQFKNLRTYKTCKHCPERIYTERTFLQ